MKLYHGSLEIVKFPEIREANRSLDYGTGFYTTTSFEQAEAWAKRRMKEKSIAKGYVNVYDFREETDNGLNVLRFTKPDEEWLDFVMANRTVKGFSHGYDIVCGPVADDRVYAAFALYEGGIINKRELIEALKAYKLIDQYLFHDEKSLTSLSFAEFVEVTI